MAELTLVARTTVNEDAGTERTITALLLVYDDENFSDEALSNDLREQLETAPNLTRIYVAAPRVQPADIAEAIRQGTSILRTFQHSADDAPMLRAISIRKVGSILSFGELLFSNVKGMTSVEEGILDLSLIQGWLFDLFMQNRGMVLAPSGVHFGKTSGKHSDRFLRAANVLLTSAACRLIAYFCLPLLPERRIRQVYVDTAPLLSVGLALVELARLYGVSVGSGRIRSFSSYSGIQESTEFRDSDLLVVSASTSGSLVEKLIDRGAKSDAVVTLFYLQSQGWPHSRGKILADLTYSPGRHSGLAQIASYEHKDCPLCAKGQLLAEFEGDQFLLQRRKTKRLKAVKLSQSNSSRAFFEKASRRRAISVCIVGPGRSRYSDIKIDGLALFGPTGPLREDVAFTLRRTVPIPLDFIVSEDMSAQHVAEFTSVLGRPGVLPTVSTLTSENLDKAEKIEEAGVLVFFSVLQDDLTARSINRALRSVAPRGAVSYVAALLISESPEARRDLLSFLRYGERGPQTFQFSSTYDLLFTRRQDRLSWDLERELLDQLQQSGKLNAELESRLDFLKAEASAIDCLFLPSQVGELAINNDFVYLDTSTLKDQISQADLYAVVSNVLASCRNDNRDVNSPLPRGSEPIQWESSIYGQVLLCPRNFKDFNDGVLHACFLRAASTSELRYDTDDALSEEMLEVLLTEVQSWQHGGGQALGEFALAITTGRLSLRKVHAAEFKRSVLDAESVPAWIKTLIQARDA